MAVYPITTWPDPVLRRECAPITLPGADVDRLYRDLCDTMLASCGLGIAAPQIGISRAMFVVDAALTELDALDAPLAFVSPRVISFSEETQRAEEGCLSFPEVFVPVTRSVQCRVRAFDLRGAPFELAAEGLFARAVQHEQDHLAGRLLIDHVGPLKRRTIKRRLQRQAIRVKNGDRPGS